jgi:hypothetical protein
MAAPITHILFAGRLLESAPLTKPDFIVGTSFPDIRYLGSIGRDATHVEDVAQDRFLDVERPFQSGFVFHSYIDKIRSYYWKKNGLLAALPQSPFLSQAFKLYEDIILYNRSSSWHEIIPYFNTLSMEEKAYPVPVEDIETWHHALQAYISKQPTIDSGLMFIDSLRIEATVSAGIAEVMEQLSNRSELPEAIETMYDSLRTRM